MCGPRGQLGIFNGGNGARETGIAQVPLQHNSKGLTYFYLQAKDLVLTVLHVQYVPDTSRSGGHISSWWWGGICRVAAPERRGNNSKGFKRLSPESQGYYLVLTVLYVPYSLDTYVPCSLNMLTVLYVPYSPDRALEPVACRRWRGKCLMVLTVLFRH